MINKLKLMFSC